MPTVTGTQKQQSTPVARLLINGKSSCAGWLVGRDLLMTNAHCINTKETVLNTAFEFMAEVKESHCSSSRDGTAFSHGGRIYHGIDLLAVDMANDYALVKLNTNVPYEYG